MVPTFCSTPRASARAARREAAERSIPSAVPNSVIVTGRRHGRHGLADRLRHALGALSEDLRGDRVDRRYLFGELRWDRYAWWVDGTPVASAYHS